MVTIESFVIISSGLIYSYTAFPSVAGGDSGELVAEACVQGSPHPPGYPLFTLALQLAIKICGDSYSAAYISNQISCLFGSLTAGFIYYSTCTLLPCFISPLSTSLKVISSLVAAYLFAFSPLVWEYSIGAEVFALNNCLTAAVLLLTVLQAAKPSKTTAYVGAFVCGLGLTNQHTLVLFEAPLILWVLYAGRNLFTFRDVGKMACFFFLGLLPYLYLFWSAQEPKRGSWGDTSSIKGFMTHLMRSEYGTLSLSPMQQETEGMLYRLFIYFEHTFYDMLYIGLPVASIGLANSLAIAFTGLLTLKKRTPKNLRQKKANSREKGIASSVAAGNSSFWIAFALFSAQIVYLLVFNYLANIPLQQDLARAVHSRFWMQPNVIVALWSGLGFATLGSKLPRGFGSYLYQLALVVLIVSQVVLHFPLVNQRERGDVLHSYGISLLRTLPKNAILLSHTDINWNTIRYLQECERKRPDVIHLSFQLMPYPWFVRQHSLYPTITFPPIFAGVSTNRHEPGNTRLVLDFIHANIKKHRHIYLDLHSINDAEIQHGGAYHDLVLTPLGMLWKVDTPDSVPSLEKWNKLSTKAFKFYDNNFQLKHTETAASGSWEFVAAIIYWDGVYQRGLHLLGYAIEMSKNVSVDSLQSYMLLLRSTIEALDRVLDQVLKKKACTYSVNDILKNTALAYMRYDAVINIAKSTSSVVSQHIVDNVRIRAIYLLKKHLKENPRDPNRQAFATYLAQITTTGKTQ